MAISRMQEPKQLMSNGGILTLADAKRMAPPGESLAYINKDEARLLKSRGGAGEDINGTGIKSYFLKKAFKKAKRAVKKISKSKLGKAALLAGGAYLTGGFMPGGGGLTGGMANFRNLGSGIGSLFNSGRQAIANRFTPKAATGFFRPNMRDVAGPVQKASFFSKLNPFGKNFDSKTAFLTGGALATAAPFIADAMAPEEVEEEVDVMDVGAIRQKARDYYQGLGGKDLAFMPQKQFVQKNFYEANADGGRVGLMNGGGAENAQAEQMLMAEYVKYKNKGGTLSFEQFVKAVMQAQQEQQMAPGAGMEQPMAMAANGGRIGFSNGEMAIDENTMAMIIDMNNKGIDISTISSITETPVETITEIISSMTQQANGGLTSVPGYGTPVGTNKFDYPSGGVRVGKQEGGIMDTEAAEMIDMGGMEKDYRNEGGFVAMGGEERADDVPARLSKNEFVFTADAVRNAGGGDIDKGAEVMENLMDNLEAGGEVSEESQGLEGAQAMYDQQQMLQSRMI